MKSKVKIYRDKTERTKSDGAKTARTKSDGDRSEKA